MVRRGRILDVALAAVLVTSAVLTVAPTSAPHPLAEVVAALWMSGVALRSTSITATVLVVSVGAISYTAVPDTPVTPLWAFIAALVVSFCVGLQAEGRRLAALGVLLLTCFLLLSARDTSSESFSDHWLSPVVIALVPLLAGRLVRHERHQTAELVRLSEELLAEREATARAAATAERNRVAGELHDVISRSVGTMVVQAGAAEVVLDHGSPARAQLDAVRSTGRQALAELRQQLGALGVDGPRALPDLADLPGLVRSSGAVLEGEVGCLDEVPPGASLAVYRVVQEALTNARKHAVGGSVSVEVRRDVQEGADELAVAVVNGPGLGLPDAPGGGHGLRGMRERVELYGGHLETGPTPDGGWRVRARLPLRSDPAREVVP